jgi:hypothetical protein
MNKGIHTVLYIDCLPILHFHELVICCKPDSTILPGGFHEDKEGGTRILRGT